MLLYEDGSGPTRVTIDLQVTQDGGLSVAGHDVGDAPRACFGKDDYEYVLSVPAEGAQPLLLALLRKVYSGRSDAVGSLRELCADHGVPHTFWCS